MLAKIFRKKKFEERREEEGNRRQEDRRNKDKEPKNHPFVSKNSKIFQIGSEARFILAKLREVISETELKEARNQKNDLGGKQHLFDVLVERDTIRYEEIAILIQKLFKENGQELRYAETVKELKVIDGKTYRVVSGEEIKDDIVVKEEVIAEVFPVFFPKIGVKNQVILPKDEYKILMDIIAMDGSIEDIEGRYSFKDVVKEAIQMGASDIHITFSEEFFYIKFRINGELRSLKKYIMSTQVGKEFIHSIKIEANKYTKGKFNADENNITQDARIEYSGGLNADVRLAFTPEGTLSGKNTVVARILLKHKIDKEKFTFEEKGYDPEFVKLLNSTKNMRGGLIFMTGITGSGKSTLLSHLIATFEDNVRVFTIEDPIEYEISGSNITQHQIFVPKDKKIAVGYLDYIKALKRSDPDVVFLGEMRNEKELVDSIVESSKAGQLVLTTTHISSCFDIYGALDQVFGMDLPTTASLIMFSVNQVLTKKLCNHCKIEDTDGVNRMVLREQLKQGNVRYSFEEPLHNFLEEKTKTYLHNEKGCDICRKNANGNPREVGFAGRTPVYEYFKPNVAFVEYVLASKPTRYQVEKEACSKGIGKSKLQCYLRMINEGILDTHPDIMNKIL